MAVLPTSYLPGADYAVRLAEARRLAASGTGRVVREASDLSMGDVARACGVQPSTVLRWERNERRPSGDAALRYLALMHELSAALPKRMRGAA